MGRSGRGGARRLLRRREVRGEAFVFDLCLLLRGSLAAGRGLRGSTGAFAVLFHGCAIYVFDLFFVYMAPLPLAVASVFSTGAFAVFFMAMRCSMSSTCFSSTMSSCRWRRSSRKPPRGEGAAWPGAEVERLLRQSPPWCCGRRVPGVYLTRC